MVAGSRLPRKGAGAVQLMGHPAWHLANPMVPSFVLVAFRSGARGQAEATQAREVFFRNPGRIRRLRSIPSRNQCKTSGKFDLISHSEAVDGAIIGCRICERPTETRINLCHMKFEQEGDKERELTAAESESFNYKWQLIGKLDDLQKSVREAPSDVDMPRDAIFGLLHAAGNLIDGTPDQNKDRAIERMRAELQNAIGPLGLAVDDKEKILARHRRDQAGGLQ